MIGVVLSRANNRSGLAWDDLEVLRGGGTLCGSYFEQPHHYNGIAPQAPPPPSLWIERKNVYQKSYCMLAKDFSKDQGDNSLFPKIAMGIFQATVMLSP